MIFMANVYEIVTEKIISLLEQGEIPWKKPWKSASGWPMNLVSKKPYRGVNVFLLHSAGFSSRWWVTFDQAKELGGHVKKGEKASLVVFWKMLEKKVEDKEGNEKIEKIPMLRYYNVFNTDQCEGLKVPDNDSVVIEFNPIEEAESIVTGMPNRPDIRHGGNKAFYSPGLDYIGMPKAIDFDSEEEYYSTLFHEMVHSTGHTSRVDRKLNQKRAAFGSEDYSKEELVAEMGAAFLCGSCGIEPKTIKNSAAYIKSWLKSLRDDKTMVVLAAAAAQRATEWILGENEKGQEC